MILFPGDKVVFLYSDEYLIGDAIQESETQLGYWSILSNDRTYYVHVRSIFRVEDSYEDEPSDSLV